MYENLSNKELIKLNKDLKEYKDREYVAITNKEIARRKAEGKMKKSAGRPQQGVQQWGLKIPRSSLAKFRI